MDTWTIVGLSSLISFVLIYVIGTRWVFRVNKQIDLLTEIRDQLKNHEDDQS
jgi:hypothetical protein